MKGAMLLDYAAKGAVVLALLASALGGFFIGRRGRTVEERTEDDAERRQAAEQDRDALRAVLSYDENAAYGITSPLSGTGNTAG